MKNETEQKRGHLVRKMTLEKKETANDAHGGVRHKKGMNQARSGSKSPVCRLYAHGVRRVVHRGAPQVPPHCAGPSDTIGNHVESYVRFKSLKDSIGVEIFRWDG